MVNKVKPVFQTSPYSISPGNGMGLKNGSASMRAHRISGGISGRKKPIRRRMSHE
jgi:hypothetical protein